jgi:hypothetical protein
MFHMVGSFADQSKAGDFASPLLGDNLFEMTQYPNRTYHQVRLGWCRVALVNLLRRWGIYLCVGALLLGGSGSQAMVALAAWAVLPLFHAAQQSLWQAMLLTLTYALIGSMLIWGLCPVLWPRAWADAERALPVTLAQRRWSDVIVVLLGLMPLFAVYATGAVIWLVKSPEWLQPLWGWAMLMLFAVMSLSLASGVAILSQRRALPVIATPGWVSHTDGHQAHQTLREGQRLSPLMALVVLPMWRGYARRAGRFFVLTLLLLWGCNMGLALLPTHISWWLAAFATLAQVLTTRLNVLVSADLESLHDSCAPLPLAARRLLLMRRAVVMLPICSGLVLLLAALVRTAIAVHGHVLVAYCLTLVLGTLALIVVVTPLAKQRQADDAAARVSWWLVILVVSLALASEVVV